MEKDKHIDNIDKLMFSLRKEIKESPEVINKVEALERLEAIAKTYEGDDRVVSSLEIAEEMKKRPEEEKFLTGIDSLDKMLGGFRRKQLIVLSASTGSGKTSMAVDLTVRMKDYNPMWFPFEETAEELIQKFTDVGKEPPLFYTPRVSNTNTLKWIEERIIEAKAKYDCKIMFIDHLHYIVNMAGQNVSQEVGNTMRQVKSLAKKWDVVIVLIAHLKKTQMDLQPTLEDLRDSSFIGQESDTVLMLWRHTEKVNGQVEISNNVNLSIQKNRRTGKTGNIRLVFKDGKFLEEEWKTTDEEYDEL